MTIVWFVVWVIANTIGDPEPLTFDPVNVWAGALLLTVALDLARQHAPERLQRGQGLAPDGRLPDVEKAR